MTGLLSCADKRDADTEAAAQLISALSNSTGTSLATALSRAKTKEKIGKIGIRNILAAQAKSKSEGSPIRVQTVCDQLGDSMNSEMGGTCTVDSCSGDLSSGLNYAVTCTDMNQSFSCGSNSFELSDFTYGLDFSYSLTDTMLDMSFDMDMEGLVSGTSLSGNMDCNMAMDFSIPLTGSDAEVDFDCDSTNFSCSIGGKNLSCSALMAATSEADCG